jgi:hypothetical protein
VVTYSTNILRSSDKQKNQKTKEDWEAQKVQQNSYEKGRSNGFPNRKSENSLENGVINQEQQEYL